MISPDDTGPIPYPNDLKYAQDEKFMAWIFELENVMQQFDHDFPGCSPYGLPLMTSTGWECWRQSYDEGMSPREAFNSDYQNWD